MAGAYQSTTIFSGSLGGGVGSAGGVGPSGAGGVLGGGIDRVSSSPCCDPTLRVSYGWSKQVVIQSIHNSLLPSLDVYASYYTAGLAGSLRPTLTNISHDDFPNFSYGVTLDLPIRNRTAQYGQSI